MVKKSRRSSDPTYWSPLASNMLLEQLERHVPLSWVADRS